MLISTTKLAAFNNGIIITATDAFQGAQNDALINDLMMNTNATGANVTLGWLGALPGMAQLRSETQKTGVRSSEYTVANYEWAQTLTVKAIDIHRDQLGVYKPTAQMLGVSGAMHPLELCANALINGFTDTDYTGDTFFKTSGKKAWTGATSFGNRMAKKLSADNFATGYANLRNRKNAFGKPMRLGRRVALVVSPTWEFTAKSIVSLQKLASGADNPYYQMAEVVVLQDLAISGTGDEWFLLEIGLPVKPLFKNEEIPFRVLSDTAMEGRDFIESHDFVWQGYYSGNVGYGLPELAYGSTGVDAA